MSSGIAWPKPVIQHEEFEMIRDVLRQRCSEVDLALESLEAARIGRELVDWFEFGIRDRDELARIIRPIAE